MSNSCNYSADNRQVGLILSRKANKAFVQITTSQACTSCGLANCKSSNAKPKPVWAINDIDAKIGDRIILEQSGKSYVYSASMVFILPICILLLSLLILQNYLNETPALMLSIVLAISYFVVGKATGLFNYFEKHWAYKVIMVLPGEKKDD